MKFYTCILLVTVTGLTGCKFEEIKNLQGQYDLTQGDPHHAGCEQSLSIRLLDEHSGALCVNQYCINLSKSFSGSSRSLGADGSTYYSFGVNDEITMGSNFVQIDSGVTSSSLTNGKRACAEAEGAYRMANCENVERRNGYSTTTRYELNKDQLIYKTIVRSIGGQPNEFTCVYKKSENK